MATNFRESDCTECGRTFVSMRIYEGGWPWKLYNGSTRLLFCSYKCRESYRKRMPVSRKEQRERARIERELAGNGKQRK